jgi:hypothetical protein
MRTINEILRDRLLAQADEAEVQGFTKIASHLTDQIEKTSVRNNSDSYTYPSFDFKNDVEATLWDVVIRVADFHNISIDPKTAQEIIEKTAEDLVRELQIKSGIDHGIGAFEPNVPGEERKTVILNIEE